jgi:anti-sigma-K factor RskA
MATEACRDWRGDLGMEALGRLEEPQRTALLAHLDGCADCRAALAELSTVARALDHADATKVEQAELVQPSGELGDRILGRLQMERAARRRRRARGVVMSVAALAAAVVVAFALAFTVGSNGGDHGKVVALKSSLPGVHARAVLLAGDEGTRVKLHVDGLHDDGDWYWLWVTGTDGRRVGAGTFSAGNKQQDLTMTAALATSRAQRVWVTDESDRVVLDGRVKPS